MSEQTKLKTFQIGDTVTWTSQAGGNAKTKTGKVTWIIPAGCLAGSYQLVEQGFSTHRCQGRERDHESYLIQVGKSKRLYWPLVKYLKPVPDTFTLPDKEPEEGSALVISKVTEKGYEMEWSEAQAASHAAWIEESEE